mmetsp:Transcript_12423/g.40625  ORF Transcript_12423/g.40625 Transcript_12423/m.40625 type:complete len:212 (-) Transcript_12423:53-688(-)
MDRDEDLVEACSRRGAAALSRIEAQFASAQLAGLRLPSPASFRAVKPYLARAPLGCWLPDFGNCIHSSQFDDFLLGQRSRFEAIVRDKGRLAFFESPEQQTWLVALRESSGCFALRFRVFPADRSRRARAEVVAATIGARPTTNDDELIRRFAVTLRDAVAPATFALERGEGGKTHPGGDDNASSDDALSVNVDNSENDTFGGLGGGGGGL